MPKATLKGIIQEVTTVEYYGTDNSGRRQSIVLFVPGYVDQFGDKKGSDEHWSIDAYNDKIEAHGLASLQKESRVEVEFYISSRQYDRKDGAGKGYMVSNRLASIKVIQAPNTNPQVGEDGLPF